FEPTANRPLGEFDNPQEPTGDTPFATQETRSMTPAAQPTQEAATPPVDRKPLENPGPPAMIREEESGESGWKVPAAGVLSLAVIGGGAWLAWNWKLRGLSQSEGLYRRLERAGRIGGVSRTAST